MYDAVNDGWLEPRRLRRRPASAPRHEPGKTVKRIETLTEHVRLKQQRGQ